MGCVAKWPQDEAKKHQFRREFSILSEFADRTDFARLGESATIRRGDLLALAFQGAGVPSCRVWFPCTLNSADELEE